ncbi:MAG: hypothetical protein V1891_03420 [bacterium]
MRKIISIFKNLYVLLLFIMLASVIYLSGFLRNYLYATIYNFQIISVFKGHIPMPNTTYFEIIEENIAKKSEEKNIDWENIKNPFIENTQKASSTKEF